MLLFAYVLRETFYEIRPMEERAALFPMVLGIPCLAFAVLAFVQEFLATLRAAPKPVEARPAIDYSVAKRRAFSIVLWILGFFLAIWLLGFQIAVPVACFLYFRFAGRETWPMSVGLSLATGAVFYALFDYVLHLPFPEGILLAWLHSVG